MEDCFRDDDEMVRVWRMGEGCSRLSWCCYLFYLERSAFAVFHHVLAGQDVNSWIDTNVNKDGGDCEDEDKGKVSTLEDMNYVLDKLHYAFDVSEDLEKMGLDSCRYSD